MHSDTVLAILVGVFIASSLLVCTIAPPFYSEKHELLSRNKDETTDIVSHLAILCLERSGSTWLTAMLNNNTGVSLVAEPLVSLAGQHKNNPLKEVSAVNELNLLVSSVSKLSADKSLRLVGFNEKFFSPKYILPSHPTVLKSFSSYLLNNNYRVVVLIRKNYVFQAVSMIRAVQLADKCGSHGWSKVDQAGWEAVCGQAQRELYSSPLDLKELQRNIQRIRSKTSELLHTAAALGLPHIVVYYEDLNERPAETIGVISRLVGVELKSTSTIYVKQGSNKLSAMASNVDEIREFLRHTDPCLTNHVDQFNPPNICLEEPEDTVETDATHAPLRGDASYRLSLRPGMTNHVIPKGRPRQRSKHSHKRIRGVSAGQFVSTISSSATE
mmetsp:Transcript_13078/g.19721  ORF Transcript_13078/g.19721 Transcript_13078/m.19721 type:complete len:385 (+) Transcript_13078:43-1197(+)